MKRNILLLWLISLSISVLAQSDLYVGGVTANVLDADGKLIEIFYNLEDRALEDRYYIVTLYGVFDNTKKQLTNVSGDVGDSVRVGNNKIVWDAAEEYPRLRGDVYFEVRVVRAFDMLKPEEGTVLKRGNEFTFEWFGEGSNSDSLLLELYQNKVLIATLDTVYGETHYLWKVPIRNPVGEGFQLKITGTEATNIEAFSKEFTIKRRIPLAVQLSGLGIAVIAGTLALILDGGGPGETDLPPPPNGGVPDTGE